MTNLAYATVIVLMQVTVVLFAARTDCWLVYILSDPSSDLREDKGDSLKVCDCSLEL